MRWSLKILEVSGIPIRVHLTFFLLFVWIGFASASVGASIPMNILFISVVFACVVLHELGHSLVAQRFGIRVQDITLLPIGGVARLERMPEKPRQEFLVAIAGPLVNVLIAGALYALIRAQGDFGRLEGVSALTGPFLLRLWLTNVFLVAFNLLPAFPMDGGRVLRALLAQRIGFLRATQIAARVGQGMALLFGLWGLFGNPLLLFIALFVYMGAEQEASLAQMRAAFQNVPVQSAMVTEFRSLSPSDPVGVAVERLLSGSQQDFPVVEADRVVGIVTRSDLLRVLAERGPAAVVRDIMRADVETVGPFEMLDRVLTRMQASGIPMVPVVYGGRLLGLLTMENVGEFMMVQAALRGTRARRSRFLA